MERIVFLFFFLLFFPSVLVSQNDTITKERIREVLEEQHYTRVPSKDLEAILDYKIGSRINDKFTFWITAIGIFIGAVGGLAAFAFNRMIRQLIDEQVKSQTEKEYANVTRYIRDSRKYTLRSDMEILRRKFELDRLSEVNIIEGKNLLSQIHEIKNQELMSDMIDFLTLMYYHKRDPAEIDKLIERYEKEYEIRETTYMNAAILYSDLYELDGSNWYREKCLKYCKAAAQKVPHYGEPQGISILIYGIDYLNSINEKEQEDALQNTRALISEILKGSAPDTAYNTVRRLGKDKGHTIFGKYIDKLEEVLPEEFSWLYKKSDEYEQRIKKPLY